MQVGRSVEYKVRMKAEHTSCRGKSEQMRPQQSGNSVVCATRGFDTVLRRPGGRIERKRM